MRARLLMSLFALCLAAAWPAAAQVTPPSATVQPPPVAPAPPPDPAMLLRRTLLALQGLQPCTITVDARGKWEQDFAVGGTITWKDWSHFVVRAQRGPFIGEAYVNGSDAWIYAPGRNVYVHGLPDSFSKVLDQLPWQVQTQITSLLRGLDRPDALGFLSAFKVTEAMLDKDPVYRLTVTPPNEVKPENSPVASISLLVNRGDFLPRRLTARGRMLNGELTLRFARPAAPFTATTFTFTPPPGATQLQSLPELLSGPDGGQPQTPSGQAEKPAVKP